jgi:hypothetical protein
MRTFPPTAALALVLAFGLGIGRSAANGTSETTVNGKVANSTYTFSNATVSGPGNFSLDQTTITNLNSINPPVTLQLILTNITYTEASVTGDGLAPTVTFSLSPTLSNAGGNLPTKTVTLTAPVIPNGQTETNVVFSLSSPIVFAPVDESNPGNNNTGTGTWTEALSNLEPSPDTILTANGGFNPSSVQNNDFTFGGTVEVVYEAVPEPPAWRMDLAASLFMGLMVLGYRRRNLRG